jgi:hypothetical protein
MKPITREQALTAFENNVMNHSPTQEAVQLAPIILQRFVSND